MMNPFDRLMLPCSYVLNEGDVEAHYHAAQQLVHPDRVPVESRAAALIVAAQVNEAYQMLKDPVARATAWLAVHQIEIPDQHDGELLMDVMTWQEELAEAVKASSSSPDRLSQLAADMRTLFEKKQAEFAEIAGHDASSPKNISDEDRKKAVAIYGYLVYLQKICHRLPV